MLQLISGKTWLKLVSSNPTKVTRTALQNAASIAALLLTTEAVVADIPEDKPEAPQAGAAGAPGMVCKLTKIIYKINQCINAIHWFIFVIWLFGL